MIADDDDSGTVWSVRNLVCTRLPNGRSVYPTTGAAVSVRWWADGRVEPLDPAHVVDDDGTIRLEEP